MCGICGSTRDPDGYAVDAMNRVLRHRGPDDEGRYLDREAGLALGARRLSIIDVEGGHQPLANENGTLWAVLNGEIYNHPGLQRQLVERGHELKSRTDTECLVHLYEDFGDELVHELEGMYAFAIWDAPRRRLLLGRDRFGEKPLFYSSEGDRLTFASELTALRAAGAAGDDLDPASMDAFFVFGYVPGPRTIIRDVFQLPPGHLLVWEHGRVRVTPYWSPPSRAATPERVSGELLEELRAVLERSVRSRMISDVPLGVFLSGGIDSTLMAALAARNSRDRIKTFTVGYDVGSVNETDTARRTSELLGAKHHELILGESHVASEVPVLLRKLDQPIADQALVALNAVAALAREEVTVAVGGEGADELFGGYPRYRWLHRADRLGRLLPARLATGTARRLRRAGWGSRSRRLADVLEPQTALERHLDWVTERRRHLRDRLYGPALRSVDPGALVDELSTLLDDSGGPIIDRFMRLDQRHWLPDDVLAKADRSTMLVSLEMRTPYLQRELAELAARIPGRRHTSRGDKSLLRAAFGDLAPLSHRDRPKTAFRVPAFHWLRGPLEGALREQVEDGALVNEGWLDRDALTILATEHRDGRADWTPVLWPILALGLWLDSFRAHG